MLLISISSGTWNDKTGVLRYEAVLLQEVEDGSLLANSHPQGSTPKLYQNIVSGTKKEVPLKEPSLFLDDRILKGCPIHGIGFLSTDANTRLRELTERDFIC